MQTAHSQQLDIWQIYDLLMFDICRDLQRENIDLALEKLPAESKEEYRKRMLHYAACLKTCKQAMDKIFTALEAEKKEAYDRAIAAALKKIEQSEAQSLDAVEADLRNLP